jgi:hypothetical protein
MLAKQKTNGRHLNFFQNKIIRFLALQGGASSIGLWLGLRSLTLAAMAGALLALYSILRNRKEWWWAIIHLAFPIAAYSVLVLQISPTYYLVAFLLLAGFNWRTAGNRVPYFPSGSITWEAVEQALPADRALRFIDIGSGLGGLTFHLAARRPESIFTGIEISPLPWLFSCARSLGWGNCFFQRGDYNRLNLGQYDVVFAYLSPAVMPAVWEKARSEMRPGSTLLSFEFDVPGVPAAQIVPAGMGGRPLYRWDF